MLGWVFPQYTYISNIILTRHQCEVRLDGSLSEIWVLSIS